MFNVLIQLKSKAVLKKSSYLTIMINLQALSKQQILPALPVFFQLSALTCPTIFKR
jgi:hypothetical protein